MIYILQVLTLLDKRHCLELISYNITKLNFTNLKTFEINVMVSVGQITYNVHSYNKTKLNEIYITSINNIPKLIKFGYTMWKGKNCVDSEANMNFLQSNVFYIDEKDSSF